MDLFCADSGAVRRPLRPRGGVDQTAPAMMCLEPWTAPRQALVGGDRRLLLAPGEIRDLHCRYRLETLA